ncbi:MAG: hypothetical protein RR182_08920, partial [Alistipes sp.]
YIGKTIPFWIAKVDIKKLIAKFQAIFFKFTLLKERPAITLFNSESGCKYRKNFVIHKQLSINSAF